MSSLSEVLGSRRRMAARNAVTAAERLQSGEARNPSAQLALEEALDDLRRYAGLHAELGPLADEVATYRPTGSHSLLRDLNAVRNGDRGAAARITAHRATGADLLEHRDVGSGSAWAAVPAWLTGLPVPSPLPISPALSVLGRTMPSGARGTLGAVKWSTPPTGAAQSALNASIATASMAESAVTPQVRTYATHVGAALQLVEQGGPAVDAAIVPELLNAVNSAISTDFWVADGTGVLHQSGVTNVVYTDSSPTLVEFIPYFEATIRAAEIGRTGAPLVFMTSARASWIRQQAAIEKVPIEFGPARMPGSSFTINGAISVFSDASLPANLGVATNQDVCVCFRSSDVVDLWMADPTVSVGNSPTIALGVYIETHRYVSLATRLPAGVAVLSGSGLTSPSP